MYPNLVWQCKHRTGLRAGGQVPVPTPVQETSSILRTPMQSSFQLQNPKFSLLEREILRKKMGPLKHQPSPIVLLKVQALGYQYLESHGGAGCFIPALPSCHHGGSCSNWLCLHSLKGPVMLVKENLGSLQDKGCCVIGKWILMHPSFFSASGLGYI